MPIGALRAAMACACVLLASRAAAQPYSFTHLAGSSGGAGSADGVGEAARFSQLEGVAAGDGGVIYVADTANHVIRRIVPGGAVTTHAGIAGARGAMDGAAGAARFDLPRALAVAADGSIYVADSGNSVIRRVTSAGVVTTVAGRAGHVGSVDGLSAVASFNYPTGVAVGADGTIYVADRGNYLVRAISPAGLVRTLAGQVGKPGSVDGPALEAQFTDPCSVAVDGVGNVYVADAAAHTIRRVTPAGIVATVAGTPFHAGAGDGTGPQARFSFPRGVAAGPAGTLYVADAGNQLIRRVTPDGDVTTLAGTPGWPGWQDGGGTTASFYDPSGVSVDKAGHVLVADSSNHLVRRVSPLGTVTTVAGLVAQHGWWDATGADARFHSPSGVAVDGDGVVYVADAQNHVIRRVTQAGTVSTWAGVPGEWGSADGPVAAARLRLPSGMAFDASGTLHFCDGASTIRTITRDGVVATLAGFPHEFGSVDGSGSAARFHLPEGLAVMPDGTVFVADTRNHTIRKVAANGEVTTIAGLAGEAGYADGTGAAARFNWPVGIVVDASGTVYVGDTYNAVIRKVTPLGEVSTLAGRPGVSGTVDGTGSSASFGWIGLLALDVDGSVLVATGNVIRRVTPDGQVTTIGGNPRVHAIDDGLGSFAHFTAARGVAVGPDATLFITDLQAHSLRRGVRAPEAAWPVVVSRAGSGVGTVSSAPAGISCGDTCTASFAGVASVTLTATPGEGSAFAGWSEACEGSEACTVTSPAFVRASFVAQSPMLVVGASGVGHGTIASSPAGIECGAVCNHAFPYGSTVTLTPTPSPGSTFVGWSGGECEEATGPCTVVVKDWTWLSAVFSPIRYLAEGATSEFFDTELAILNPAEWATTATVSFMPAGRAPVKTEVYVPAFTRVTLDPKSVLGTQAAEFSTTIVSGWPLVVDRTMRWGNGAGYGAHAETAVLAPALRWYLAEGATHSGFDLFYLLQNPNASAAEVRVRYLRPSGVPLEKLYTLPPQSRTNIWVDFEEFPGLGLALSNTDVSAVFDVLNAQPIMVERAMYAEVPGQTFGAGHASAGVTTPALEWFLAEGATGPSWDLFVLIANPADETARIEATYLLPDGSIVVKPYEVDPASRFTIWVDHEDARLASTAVSTTMRSLNDVPVIVERAMWWPDGGWYEAHNSVGATATGTRWAFAAGEADLARGLETYLLVANTSTDPATVRVSLYFEGGGFTERVYDQIAGRSRFNVAVAHEFPEARGRRFGAVVESLGDPAAPIVVERATYWDAAGQRWAAGTNTLGTRLQ